MATGPRKKLRSSSGNSLASGKAPSHCQDTTTWTRLSKPGVPVCSKAGAALTVPTSHRSQAAAAATKWRPNPVPRTMSTRSHEGPLRFHKISLGFSDRRVATCHSATVTVVKNARRTKRTSCKLHSYPGGPAAICTLAVWGSQPTSHNKRAQ